MTASDLADESLMLAPTRPTSRNRRFRNGQGVGFRIAWNQATIIVATTT